VNPGLPNLLVTFSTLILKGSNENIIACVFPNYWILPVIHPHRGFAGYKVFYRIGCDFW
jgi:hypothetical protein